MGMRHLFVHRLTIGGQSEYHVTGYEIDGQRVDLTNTPRGLNTGVLAEKVMSDWQAEGFITHGALQDQPGKQILLFRQPTEQEKFLSKYAPPEPKPEPPAKPGEGAQIQWGDKPLVTL